jgi:Domain of unknown function (DUF4261)
MTEVSSASRWWMRVITNGEVEDAANHSLAALGGWKLPRHGAHIIVAMPPRPNKDALDSLKTFTHIVAAVAKAHDAVAVYDGNAHATHPTAVFAAASTLQEMVTLWTGVSVARDGSNRISLLSLGMKRFDRPDLLFTAPRRGESAQIFFELLAYAVDRKAAPADGETIGRSATEKWKVRYVPSPIDKSVKVWSVNMP